MNADATGFVVAAYLVTLLGIGAYAVGLGLRIHSARMRLEAAVPGARVHVRTELEPIDEPEAWEDHHVA